MPPPEVGGVVAGTGLGEDVYIGRQAVFDARRRVIGYELLYRRCDEDLAVVGDGTEATRSVVSAAMVEFGLEQLVRGGVAFVNVTREFLASGLYRALPADRVVLEVLEDEAVDDAFIGLLGAVRAEGYRLALDDYTPGTALGRLVPLADIVKVDVLATPRQHLRALIEDLRSRGVAVLAEKVETRADLEVVRGLGSSWCRASSSNARRSWPAARCPSVSSRPSACSRRPTIPTSPRPTWRRSSPVIPPSPPGCCVSPTHLRQERGAPWPVCARPWCCSVAS